MTAAVSAIGAQEYRDDAAARLRALADKVEAGEASVFWAAAYPEKDNGKADIEFHVMTSRNVNVGLLYMAASKYMPNLLAYELGED